MCCLIWSFRPYHMVFKALTDMYLFTLIWRQFNWISTWVASRLKSWLQSYKVAFQWHFHHGQVWAKYRQFNVKTAAEAQGKTDMSCPTFKMTVRILFSQSSSLIHTENKISLLNYDAHDVLTDCRCFADLIKTLTVKHVGETPDRQSRLFLHHRLSLQPHCLLTVSVLLRYIF